MPYWEFVSKLPTAVLFNDDLWNEPNFGRIHFAGQNLESVMLYRLFQYNLNRSWWSGSGRIPEPFDLVGFGSWIIFPYPDPNPDPRLGKWLLISTFFSTFTLKMVISFLTTYRFKVLTIELSCTPKICHFLPSRVWRPTWPKITRTVGSRSGSGEQINVLQSVHNFNKRARKARPTLCVFFFRCQNCFIGSPLCIYIFQILNFVSFFFFFFYFTTKLVFLWGSQLRKK